jgi:MFS family permease
VSAESRTVAGTWSGAFRSLNSYNYRVWAIGALISNIGAWMQRTAQDWLVLTELTHNNATAVGIVVSLQFGPHLLLLPLTGYAADRFDRRKIVIVTQASLGLLALALGLITVLGVVRLWHVYVFAGLLGCVSAFDSPARQTFVAQLAGEENLPNAVGLNSTSFNLARTLGPAVAGILIASVGTGWVFLINAASFVAVLVSLGMIRRNELHQDDRLRRVQGNLVDGFRYVWRRPDLKAVLFMLFLIGTFGLNFPIFISTMAVAVFHTGSRQYGLLTSMMAVGSVIGALLAARRVKPDVRLLLTSSAIFGVGCAVAALMPKYGLFGLVLVIVGVASQTLTTSTNSYVQLSTDPSVRGRVVAILLAIAVGGTPLGAPMVGWVADTFGPRWALGVGAAAGICGAAVLAGFLALRRPSLADVQAKCGRGSH